MKQVKGKLPTSRELGRIHPLDWTHANQPTLSRSFGEVADAWDGKKPGTRPAQESGAGFQYLHTGQERSQYRERVDASNSQFRKQKMQEYYGKHAPNSANIFDERNYVSAQDKKWHQQRATVIRHNEALNKTPLPENYVKNKLYWIGYLHGLVGSETKDKFQSLEEEKIYRAGELNGILHDGMIDYVNTYYLE